MSAKTPVSSKALRQQKSDAQKRLVGLRQDQVNALEQGDDFQHNNEILLINERLAALDTAISRAEDREQQERARLALQETRQTALELIDGIRDIEAKRLQELASAQTAFDLAVSSIFSCLEIAKKEQELCRAAALLYNDQPIEFRRVKGIEYGPGELDFNELTESAVRARIGRYMASSLMIFVQGEGNGRMGDLSWSLSNRVEGSWHDNERPAVEGRIERDLALNLSYIVKAIPEALSDAAE